MKRRNVLALVLCAALLVCGLAACGGNVQNGEGGNGGAQDTPAVKGAEQTFGNITLFVPEEMTLTGGSMINKDDPGALTLKVTGNETHYIMFNTVSEESAKSSIETTKEINAGAADVTLTLGDVTWTGVAYKYQETCDCFQLYATIGEKALQVGGAYFAYDGDVVKAVLESVKLA